MPNEKTTAPKFDANDAQVLVQLAQNAPLRNLREAQGVSELLQRFTAWFNDVTASPADDSAPTPPAPRKRRSRIDDVPPPSAPPASPDSTVGDVTA